MIFSKKVAYKYETYCCEHTLLNIKSPESYWLLFFNLKNKVSVDATGNQVGLVLLKICIV